MYEKGKPLSPISITDILIDSEVVLPHGDNDSIAKFIRRSIGIHGQVIGNHKKDPIINT